MKNVINKIKKWSYTKDGEIQQDINMQLIVIVVSIFITVITVIGVTYSAFVWSDNSEKNQNIVAGNVVLSISSTSGELGSGLNYPVEKSAESTLEPYTFTIKNNGTLPSVYEIKIAEDTSYTNNLNKEYIFMSLSGSKTLTRRSLKLYHGVAIDTGILEPGETKTYDLRLWIVEDAPNTVIGNEWHGKILLESSQTIEWIDENKLLTDTIFEDNEIITSEPNLTTDHTDLGLYVAQGDSTVTINGDPTYYFRGNVDNNYVSFASKLWRIVRINENGTIKLILNDKDESLVFNTSDIHVEEIQDGYEGSLVETTIEEWYTNNLSNYDSYIVNYDFHYMHGPNMHANMEIINSYTKFVPSDIDSDVTNYVDKSILNRKIGLISIPEHVRSGNFYSYLNTEYYHITMNSTYGQYWNIRANYGGSENKYTDNNGNYVTDKYYARPVINLKSDTTILSGNGTKVYPYIVK